MVTPDSPTGCPGVVVFDLETVRGPDECGGWKNAARFGLAVGVTWCEAEGFRDWFEPDAAALVEYLGGFQRVVGFNVLGFDYKVLGAYYAGVWTLLEHKTLDLLWDFHRLTGRRIEGLRQHRPDLRFPLPPALETSLVGRRMVGFGRRAKYIQARLDDDWTILLHLGMSGRLLFDGQPAGPHEHLTFGFDDGTVLRFVDPRRFGMLGLCPTGELARHPWLAQQICA